MSLQRNTGAVRSFLLLTRFAAWMSTLPNKLTPPPFRLMQIGSSFWQSRALYVAARLDIASIIGKDQLYAEEIAERVEAQADAVYRLLRMLSSLGIFEERARGVFANNRMSLPLCDDNPESVRAMILMHNSDEMSRPWYEQLEGSVRHGGVPFVETHGRDLFEYMDACPEFDALFSRAMDSVEALAGDCFATDFNWSCFDRVIDVGGSVGSKAVAILERNKHLNALVIDRAQVIATAPQRWQGRCSPDVLGRLDFQAGDVFESVPPATSEKDIYLLSAVLHCFDDELCVRALQSLAAAAGKTGALIAVMELVLPECGADQPSVAFDMQMFMGTRGRERTLKEWVLLFSRAGLELQEQVRIRSFASVLVVRCSSANQRS